MTGQCSSTQPSNKSLIRRSASPNSDNDDRRGLEHALAVFQANLTDDERTKLKQTKESPCDSYSVIIFTADLDRLKPDRKGKSVATRLYSLLQTIQQFSQVLDSWVSSHPEIAALVWGSVKLTFMVLANFTSYFESFSQLLRGFDQLCPRFAEYRLLFPDSVRLRRATYEFHAAIVSCCSQLVTTTRRPWQQHLLSALSRSFQSEIQPYVDDIRVKAKQVQREVELAKAQADHQEHLSQAKERQEASETRRGLFKWFHESDRNMREIKQDGDIREKERKWESLLAKLSSHDHAAAFKSARAKRHNGTAEWVFDNKEFQCWYKNDGSALLHIAGKIGSGKTVLTANIVDYLIKHRQSRQAVSFFFVRFDNTATLDSEQILRSLVRQILNHGSHNEILLDLLEASSDAFFDTETILALWVERIKWTDEYFLVLDGFDECPAQERKAFLNSLLKLCDLCERESKVKILLSSRESISEEISRCNLFLFHLTLDSSKSNDDLMRYAEEIIVEKLSTKALVIKDEDLLGEILQTINIGGEGMFLWVYLTIEDICTRRSDPDIRRALRHIPRNLPDTFDRALGRIISNGNKEIARVVFRWIAAVRQPLTLEQLREALTVEVGQKYLQSERLINGIERLVIWCEDLVQVDDGDETVHFSHHSIRTYLLEPAPKPLGYLHVDKRDATHHVGEICLTYLNFNDFKTALIKQSSINSTPTVDIGPYPAAIAEQAVRSAIPGISGARVASFFKRSFKKPKRRVVVRSEESGVEGSQPRSASLLEYPFLQYATVHWLFHTFGFSPSRSMTWKIWQSMVSDEKAPWMDEGYQPPGMPEANPDTLGIPFASLRSAMLHKVLVYADFIGHHALFHEILELFRKESIRLNSQMLEAYLPHRRIYRNPLERTGYIGKASPHIGLVSMVTEHFARGGIFWPRSLPWPWVQKCDTNCSHIGGMHNDVCAIINSETDFNADEKPWINTFALVSILEMKEGVVRNFIKKQMVSNRHNIHVFSGKTLDGKNILNLALERGGDHLETVVVELQNMLSVGGDSADFAQVVREGLLYALKSCDTTSVGLLARQMGEAQPDSLDEEILYCALKCPFLSRSSRTFLLSACIPNSRLRVEQVRKAAQALLDSTCGQQWDFAIELFRIGARLTSSDLNRTSDLEGEARGLLDSVFDCIDLKPFALCELKYSSGDRPTLSLCEYHNKAARRLIESYGKPAAEMSAKKVLCDVLGYSLETDGEREREDHKVRQRDTGKTQTTDGVWSECKKTLVT